MAFAARMSALAEQLSKRLMDGGSIERRDLSTQLLNLSKFIDHAVASNQKPPNAPLIFQCFKQFTYFKYDEMLRPSVMVLMLSIKSACLAAWFSNSEVEELLQTYKFLSLHFLLDGECAKKPHSSLGEPVSNEIRNAESFMAMICKRYYPRMTAVSALVALTAKQGYDSLGIDFQVTSQLAMYTRLRLFVCQKDDTGTSACLVTPPLLSFLVNGKGVEKRVYVPPTPELGPQLPSDITPMLRIGCNFLQIIGENTANYFVAVAVMGSVLWTSSVPKLEDYVNPSPVAETDDEVIVGRTRVSLRCPVSLKRISTPVKGVSCRHHQAFDYDSYIEINDRRPSWRCPCCNTYVNCSEIRLDRRMEQILKEMDQNLFDVMINHDGSWAPDVPADESDVAHIQREGQTLGEDLAERLEESVIIISDDEEDEQQVGALVSRRESYAPQVSTVSATSVPLVDMVDRKPDIRTTVVNEAVGSAPTHTPVSVSSRESPVLNAIYSEIPQGGSATTASVRSIQAPQGGYISTTQSAVRNPSSWVPAAGFWSPTGQLPDSRSVVMERQLHTQPSRPSVIQALPAQTQYSNPSERGRVTLTGHVSALPTMPPLQVPSAGQLPCLLPTTLAHEVQALQQQLTQQQQHRNADSLDMMMLQELRQVQQQQLLQQQQLQQQQQQQQLQQQQQQQQQQQLQQQQHQQQLQQQLQQQQLQQQQQQAYNQSQRNQRHGQRPTQQQLRDARAHQLTSASSHQAGQGQQSSNQLGQQMHYPVNSNLQGSLPVQDYYHRHRLSQQLQQAGQASSSPRGSPFPVANGGSVSGLGAATGGSQRDLASQTSSHSMYSGRTTSVSNIPAASTNNSYPGLEGWVPPPQHTNWRQGTARMRGSVVVGATAGVSSGVRGTSLSGMTQAGQVNIRTRVSSNTVSTVPATPLQTMGQGTVLWAGRSPFNAAGNGEILMAPEPVSATAIMEDITWPSTLLDNSAVDNIDPVSWIEDPMFHPMSPPPQ